MKHLLRVVGVLCCLAPQMTLAQADPTCGYEWQPVENLPGVFPSASIIDVVEFDDGSGPSLFVAGNFQVDINGDPTQHLLRWDGDRWHRVGSRGSAGLSGMVRALAVYDDGTGPALFAGGSFAFVDDIQVNAVAKWDGIEWTPLAGPSGTGIDQFGYVNELAVFDDGSGPSLYVGGDFDHAGGIPSRSIARWDGTSWQGLQGGVSSAGDAVVYSLEAFDGGAGESLYVGGFFSHAGDTDIGFGIAAWDGATWSALPGANGKGVFNSVRDMAVFDDGHGAKLYMTGFINSAGGVEGEGFPYWDGSQWDFLPVTNADGTVLSLGGVAFSLAVVEDEFGLDPPRLYAAGTLSIEGEVYANAIVQYDGAEWTGLGVQSSSTQGTIFGAFDVGSGPQLIAYFDRTVCGLNTWPLATWTCSFPPQCVADINSDGTVDLTDLNLVVMSFDFPTYCGDINDDGTINLADLNAVLAAFGTDCR